MPATASLLDALAEELGAVAGRIERESTLRLDAAIAELRRIDAERELRLTNLERAVADRLASVRDGAPGRDGVDGKDGAPGAKGRDGLDGKPGVDGNAGRDGIDGKDGAPGAPGRDGVDGAPGVDGRDGVDGKPGEPGTPGRDGVDGARGIDGKDGRDGEPGARGECGATGERGERGEQGLRGEIGERGADGAPGRDGANGIDGKDGAPGMLPLAKQWTDGVHYAGAVVTHAGSSYQAQRDTGRAPPHEDWICIALGGSDGKDGRSPRVRETWSAAIADYHELDIVALGGAAFIARRNNPGPCPGEGWQLIASQGKRGNQGERGAPGPKGSAGPAIARMSADNEGLLIIVNADGSTVECDLYPLLSKLR